MARHPDRAIAAQDVCLAWLGPFAKLDLEVGGLRIGPFEQQLLDRLPVGGVVDVAGDVDVGGTKAPRRALGVR